METFLSLLQKKQAGLLRVLLPLVTILISLNALKAQNVAKKTPKSGIWYLEYLPPDYNTNTNNYPIVFFLHGLGERGDDSLSVFNVARNGPPKYTKNGYKFPFILVSPQLKSKYTGWPNSYIDEVIEYCRNLYRVDQSRIYLTGLSLGGGGTWGYTQDPILNQKLAAVAVMCGHQNNPLKACNIVNSGIPVWAFHGDADTVVPYTKTVNMVKAINACVPAPNPLALVTIYPGVGHDCWDNAYRTDHLLHNPNVYEWLLQYKNGGVHVSAGNDITLTLPLNSTNLTGVASTETGSITSYSWTIVSGPAGAVLTNATTPTATVSNLSAGIYTLRLTASNGTETATDDVKITVNAAVVNQNPVANAGPDVTITTSSVVLNGSGSDPDGTIASYAWAKVSGGAATLSGQTTATLSLSGLVAGTYVFSLTVKDNLGATATDNVTVTVSPPNQPPTVNGGADITLNLPTNSTNIKAIASDPDGTIASYLWEELSGPAATLANANTATVSLSGLVEGSYIFRITVKDNAGASATDQVAITVIKANQSPVANAGADITLTQPTSSTNITGSGTDPDGSIQGVAWTTVSSPAGATPILTNDLTTTVTASSLSLPGAYVFRLTVTDNGGSTAFDDVKVTVNAAPVNVPPVANAGADQSITLPTNSTVLNGSGTDSDGTIASYAWTKVSGGVGTLTNANTASLSLSALDAGTYVFRLTVTDNQSASSSDDVTLTVQPAPVNALPVANAGADVVLTLPNNSTVLNGSGTDSDGTIASYTWSKTSGPSTFTLTNQNTATLTVNDMVAGTYVFQLVVTDDKGATDTDDVTVTVNAANVPPTANAGADVTITLPTQTTDLTGSGTDADGTIASYLWAQVSGPSTATLTNATAATVNISALTTAGTYVFSLTVTDDKAATGTDNVKVIVNAPANQAPTANAGADQTITLPTNSTNFTGSGTDPEGAVTYQWTITPSTGVTLTNSTTPTVTVTVPSSGSYTLSLTVTDTDGATDTDDAILVVNAAVNLPPTANAGPNQTITLPVNSLTLSGSGTDPEGNIKSYLWTLVSGPAATMTNADTPTLSLADLIEGTYKFRLTVTDDQGQAATSDVTVTVFPQAINQPPVANAGADQTLSSSTTSTTLFGSGSDADGTVTAYEWSMTSGSATLPADLTTTSLTVTNLTPGTYTFQLKVTDDKGATATDNVTVTVSAPAANQNPIANAGLDKKITLPTNALTLKGTGSDPDGDPLTYSWVKVSGPSFTQANQNTPNLSLSNLVQGIYVFRLQVDDGKGGIGTDDVKVTVNAATVNQPPTVSVGADQTIFLPTNSITISGTASDPDGSIASYTWTQTAGPGTATLANATTATLTASNLVATAGVDYVFRLTVKDNNGATAFDEVKVTVQDATVNQPPTLNNIADITVKLPANSTTITAVGNDPEGGALTYHWEELNGPSSLSFTDTNPVSITGMVEGTYDFQVIVTDDASNTDTTTVTVSVISVNQPPTADAGGDVTIQLPESTASMTGSFTDDGTTSTVAWTQVSGPTVTLSGADTNTLSVSNITTDGTYVFRYTVNDNDSPPLSDFDDVTLLVLPADVPNNPPTVVIEGDSVLTLPDNSTTLTAIAQSDGLIQSYKWEQVFGNPLSIDTDTTNILQISNLTIGTYAFRATVLDQNNQEGSDDFIVYVNAGPDNVFSPNGDKSFDTWKIGNTPTYTDCEINVYDRQGSKVFHSKGYETEWDGTFNGKPLPEGVYFYVIRCPSQKQKSGSVTIIR